ncbi:MAG: aminopeptidase P family protein [Acidimicrobiia bacterium]|nr:aminopeptidase P family protein [Acidimicrobiia bacterium]
MGEATFEPIGLDKDRLSALLRERGLAGVLLTSPANVMYTTGFPTLAGAGNPIMHALSNQFPTWSYVDGDGHVTLVCWGVATFGVSYGADAVRPFFTRGLADTELVALAAGLGGGRRVGVEASCPWSVVRILEEHCPDSEIVACDDILDALRLLKSPAEIEMIRRSTAIIEQTVTELVPVLSIGMSRLDLLREARARMLANGAHGIDHVTIAFGSANPEVALGELLEPNQLVTLDLGAVYEGYVSDNRRYAFTGVAPDALREQHRQMCGIVSEVGSMLRPGVTFGDLPVRARELYAEIGRDPLFLTVGHSMGLQVEERWITDGDDTEIAPGMVLNVELYSFTEGGVLVGDEETYVVTDGDPEQITVMPADLIEV